MRFFNFSGKTCKCVSLLNSQVFRGVMLFHVYSNIPEDANIPQHCCEKPQILHACLFSDQAKTAENTQRETDVV